MEERNVGTVEQAVRMVVGGLASLSGIVLLVPGETSLTSGAVGTMLVIAGLYLFVTGSTRYCPNYRRLGWAPWRTEEQHGAPTDRWHRVLMILYCLPLIAIVAWVGLGVRDMSSERRAATRQVSLRGSRKRT